MLASRSELASRAWLLGQYKIHPWTKSPKTSCWRYASAVRGGNLRSRGYLSKLAYSGCTSRSAPHHQFSWKKEGQRRRPRCIRVGASREAGPEIVPTAFTRLKAFLLAQYLPVGLLTAVSLGFLFPSYGVAASRLGLAKYATAAIFVITGLTLRVAEARKALASWPALMYGLASILLITPWASLPVLQLPLHPHELRIGLAVFCCLPTTVSSGISLVQAVGGNTVLAVGLTVVSNLLGTITVPFLLSALLGQSGGIALPPGPLFLGLVQTILIPLLIGLGARSFIQVAERQRKTLGLVTNTLLCIVPWTQLSCSRDALLAAGGRSLLAALAAGVGVHLVYICWNLLAVGLLPLAGQEPSKPDKAGVDRAIVILASQKTLPMAVAVLDRLGPGLGDKGLMVLPCIAAHLTQIVLDSLLVSYWLRRDQRED